MGLGTRYQNLQLGTSILELRKIFELPEIEEIEIIFFS